MSGAGPQLYRLHRLGVLCLEELRLDQGEDLEAQHRVTLRPHHIEGVHRQSD